MIAAVKPSPHRYTLTIAVARHGDRAGWAAALCDRDGVIYRTRGDLGERPGASESALIADARANFLAIAERVKHKKQLWRARLRTNLASLPASLDAALLQELQTEARDRAQDVQAKQDEASLRRRRERLEKNRKRARRRVTGAGVAVLEKINHLGAVSVERGRRDSEGSLLKTLAHPGSSATLRKLLHRLEEQGYLKVRKSEGSFGPGTLYTFTPTQLCRDLVASLEDADAPAV